MLLQPPSSSTTAVALVLLMGLAVGCGAPQTGTGTAADQQAVNDQKALTTTDPQVGSTELQCITTRFKDHIHHGDAGNHQPIGPRDPLLMVKVGSLQDAVAQLTCTSGGGVDHAVIVHPGLTDQNTFDVLLQVVCLKYDGTSKAYTYDPTDVGYTIDGQGQLVLDSAALPAWEGLNGPGTRYRTQVVIRRGKTGPWGPFELGHDVQAITYAYEGGLADLIAHNGLAVDDTLMVEPAAEFELADATTGQPKQDSYVQGVVWVPVGITINDSLVSGTPYKNKAANLGAPCPVNCVSKAFSFPLTGTDGCL